MSGRGAADAAPPRNRRRQLMAGAVVWPVPPPAVRREQRAPRVGRTRRDNLEVSVVRGRLPRPQTPPLRRRGATDKTTTTERTPNENRRRCDDLSSSTTTTTNTNGDNVRVSLRRTFQNKGRSARLANATPTGGRRRRSRASGPQTAAHIRQESVGQVGSSGSNDRQTRMFF